MSFIQNLIAEGRGAPVGVTKATLKTLIDTTGQRYPEKYTFDVPVNPSNPKFGPKFGADRVLVSKSSNLRELQKHLDTAFKAVGTDKPVSRVQISRKMWNHVLENGVPGVEWVQNSTNVGYKEGVVYIGDSIVPRFLYTTTEAKIQRTLRSLIKKGVQILVVDGTIVNPTPVAPGADAIIEDTVCNDNVFTPLSLADFPKLPHPKGITYHGNEKNWAYECKKRGLGVEFQDLVYFPEVLEEPFGEQSLEEVY